MTVTCCSSNWKQAAIRHEIALRTSNAFASPLLIRRPWWCFHVWVLIFRLFAGWIAGNCKTHLILYRSLSITFFSLLNNILNDKMLWVELKDLYKARKINLLVLNLVIADINLQRSLTKDIVADLKTLWKVSIFQTTPQVSTEQTASNIWDTIIWNWWSRYDDPGNQGSSVVNFLVRCQCLCSRFWFWLKLTV